MLIGINAKGTCSQPLPEIRKEERLPCSHVEQSKFYKGNKNDAVGKQNMNKANIFPIRDRSECREEGSEGNEAKIQIMQEYKLSEIFRKWKKMLPNLRRQVQIESRAFVHEVKTKFNVFSEWKRLAIDEKKAVEFYNKKIYRTFMIQCSSLLQIRLKTIYCEQLLKKSQFPLIYGKLKQNQDVLVKKMKRVVVCNAVRVLRINNRMLRFHQSWNRLAKLHYERNIKRKYWRLLGKCQQQQICEH